MLSPTTKIKRVLVSKIPKEQRAWIITKRITPESHPTSSQSVASGATKTKESTNETNETKEPLENEKTKELTNEPLENIPSVATTERPIYTKRKSKFIISQSKNPDLFIYDVSFDNCNVSEKTLDNEKLKKFLQSKIDKLSDGRYYHVTNKCIVKNNLKKYILYTLSGTTKGLAFNFSSDHIDEIVALFTPKTNELNDVSKEEPIKKLKRRDNDPSDTVSEIQQNLIKLLN